MRWSPRIFSGKESSPAARLADQATDGRPPRGPARRSLGPLCGLHLRLQSTALRPTGRRPADVGGLRQRGEDCGGHDRAIWRGPLGGGSPCVAGKAIGRAAIDSAGFRFSRLNTVDDPDFLPGGAKYNDLPGMLALSAPCPLWLAGENGPEVSLVSAAYRAAGHANRLTVCRKDTTAESAAVDWLLRD